MRTTAARRLAAVTAVAGSAVIALAAPAFAHVTVQPGAATQGGYTAVAFRVPDESDTASTVKLEVSLPLDHPLASVRTMPLPGWTAVLEKTKLATPMKTESGQITEAVSKVTWTATGKGIEPGFFQKFPLSVGQLPENADELVFKAIQTYDNKEVVRWIEPQAQGAEEPENPAPVLALSAASEEGHHGAAAEDASDTSTPAAEKSTSAASSSDSDTTARVLGIVGIVVGVAGGVFGLLAGRRRAGA